MTDPAPTPAIKGCPFCGEVDAIHVHVIRGYIACKACGAHGPVRKTKRHVYEAWNRRTPSEAPTEAEGR